MYKVLLVDDEPIEREALKLLYSNNFKNLVIAGEAQNGFEAIDKSKDLEPDIIVMDIKMPGINGIEAIREIKKHQPEVKFLILSSYNEFEYAQQALQLGAEDYVVKPAKMQIMLDIMRNIIEKLENEKSKKKLESTLYHKVESIKPLVENDMFSLLISGCSNEKFLMMQEFLGVSFNRAYCMAVSSQNMSDFILNRIKTILSEIGEKCIGSIINGTAVLFISYENDYAGQESHSGDIASYLKKKLDWDNLRKIIIGVGKLYDGSNGFRCSYLEALEALNAAILKQKEFVHINKVEACVQRNNFSIMDWDRKFFENILTGDMNQNDSLAYAFLNEVEAFYGNSLEVIKDKVYQVMVLVDKRFGELFGTLSVNNEVASILEEVNELSELKSLHYWIVNRLHRYINATTDGKSAVNVKSIVKSAVDYISKKYSESITLDDVAEKLAISTFYLSKILKKHTGKNYTDMLTEMRINRAKELLAGNDFSIKEVTHMCGFNSQNYFAKIFRKFVGVTPTEFKSLQIEKRLKDNP